MLSTKIIQR